MKIKKLLTPLLLILLLVSMVVFGAPQPVGPYFDDTYLEYGNDGLNVKTATVTDGDTTHVPTSDNVYDFCETTQDYMQDLVDDTTPQLGGNLDANDHAILENVTTVTTTHTMTVAEAGVVLVSASSDYTITLPTAVGNTGLTYKFKKIDANYNCITLDGNGSETINYENADGVPKETYARLNTYGAEVTLVSDGSNWQAYDEALGQVPYCNVYVGTVQEDIPSGILTIVNYGSETTDIGDNFTNAVWVSGTADGTVAGHLQDDTNHQFTTAMVGYQVHNTTDDTYAIITAYNDTGDVTISKDIFVDTEAYEIRHSKFVVPIAGKYRVNLFLLWNNLIADKSYSVTVFNGSGGIATSYIHSSTVTYLSNSVNGIYVFAKDDVITIKVKQLAGIDTPDIAQYASYPLIIQLVEKD